VGTSNKDPKVEKVVKARINYLKYATGKIVGDL
jgi:hypothetical protein